MTDGIAPAPALRFVPPEDVARLLPWPRLIEALRRAFKQGATVPQRHHHRIEGVSGAPDGTLLLMPAWRSNGRLGIKIAHVCPGNAARGQPSVSALYVLSDAQTGQHLALIDGGELTARRTAAASALAADYLSRRDASSLLILGTGRLAAHVAAAHRAVRPLKRIGVWGRNADKAKAKAHDIATLLDIDCHAVSDLSHGVAEADIITGATLSTQPLIEGRWLKPGAHVDLIGAFTPEMREADDETLKRSSLFVDTIEAAPKEAGELLIPLRNGIISLSDIKADLFGLCRGLHPGRLHDDEITVFKSVGHALEDLAAAELVYEAIESA